MSLMFSLCISSFLIFNKMCTKSIEYLIYYGIIGSGHLISKIYIFIIFGYKLGFKKIMKFSFKMYSSIPIGTKKLICILVI